MAKLAFIHIAALAVLLNIAAAVSAYAETLHADIFSARSISLFSSNAKAAGFSSQSGTVALIAPSEIGLLILSDAAILDEDLTDAAAGPFSLAQGEEFFVEKRVVGDPTLLAQATGTRGAEEEWPWRRAGTAEYVTVSLAAVGTAFFEHKNGKPTKAKWTSRNGFDESIRDALRLKSRSAREATHNASNVIMGVMIGAPVVESLATLGFRDKRWDALLQTEMINLESFIFTSLVSSVMQNLITRERPFVRNCADERCEGELENRGMPSGHVAFAFTGAGLLCNHHKYQTIYEDPAVGRAVCAAGIGVSVLDGVLRIVSDRHYATDVAVGTVIGLFSGFVLPRLLHYSRPQERSLPEAKGTQDSAVQLMAVTPEFLSGGAALNCDFSF
ncbi:MAG: hypothetical protein A2075_15170 [Geobacteraceae bacterium GWC2_58_44]|nr:MAG: hypothetical protein A2075_15170 [Geobacteraceae bacterium GWC2_58_44]HBG04909.1 hypothetical protein [Geobacter sp.]